MKIKVRDLKRLLKEQLLIEDVSAPSLGKLLDDMAGQFASKMSAQYPQATEVIQREASQLKMQIMATIKASAAKVKMAASENN